MVIIQSFTFTTYELIVQILYGALAMLLLLTGADLLTRYLQADKRTRQDAAYLTFFIIAAACLTYGIYLFPAILDYFYADKVTLPRWIPAFKVALFPIILYPIAFVCSSILIRAKWIKYLIVIAGGLTILYAILMIIFEATLSSNPIPRYSYPIWFMVAPIGLFDLIGITVIFVIKLSPQKEIRKKVFIGLFGIFMGFAIGEPLQLGERSSVWGVIGILVEIFGFVIMRQAFLSIPSYDEFEWRNGMIELHIIIADTGISLFHHKFSQVDSEQLRGDLRVTATVPEDENRPNSDLVAGGLVGIKGMLSEISGEKGKLEQIEIGEKSLIFKQGKVAMALLLADENLGVYHSILEDLIEQIELTHPDLERFSGDTRKLKIKPLVEKAFAIEIKEKENNKET